MAGARHPFVRILSVRGPSCRSGHQRSLPGHRATVHPGEVLDHHPFGHRCPRSARVAGISRRVLSGAAAGPGVCPAAPRVSTPRAADARRRPVQGRGSTLDAVGERGSRDGCRLASVPARPRLRPPSRPPDGDRRCRALPDPRPRAGDPPPPSGGLRDARPGWVVPRRRVRRHARPLRLRLPSPPRPLAVGGRRLRDTADPWCSRCTTCATRTTRARAARRAAWASSSTAAVAVTDPHPGRRHRDPPSAGGATPASSPIRTSSTSRHFTAATGPPLRLRDRRPREEPPRGHGPPAGHRGIVADLPEDPGRLGSASTRTPT